MTRDAERQAGSKADWEPGVAADVDAVAARAAIPASPSLPSFPFTALIGQTPLRQALLLAAVEPGLGGVLVSGPRGTAKSTAARALAELLPDGRLVTLPLSASEEQVTGSLDLASALADHAVRFAPGLLARAHRGVLYVDEINLLPDTLVDALLDAAASGINTIERDGVSHSHAARFTLIGTMNPEEGELRPQLLDRFGLMVTLENCYDVTERQRIVKARLDFDLDPTAFRRGHAQAQTLLAQRIRDARAALPQFGFDDAVHARVSELCIAAQVDGMRADLVMLRAARALAALEGAGTVEPSHVERVAESVLRHRRSDRAGAGAGAGAPAPAGTRTGAPTDEAATGTRGGPPAGRSPAPSQGGAANGASSLADATDQGDWGYLPPEPVGMAAVAAVKGVTPLALKKR